MSAGKEATRESPLDIVIPLRVRGRHYWENAHRVSVLLSSLAEFAAPGTFRRLYVIVPDDEWEAANSLVDLWPQLPIRVVSESRYLSAEHSVKRFVRLRPWHYQQIIKLAACAISRSPFCLVMDPDMFATRRFSIRDLVWDGKALAQIEPKSVHAPWWRASAKLLSMPMDWASPGLGVTPEILSSTLCQGLLNELTERHGKPWYEVLKDQSHVMWTEYTLYWLYAEREGLLGAYHHIDERIEPKLIGNYNVWNRKEFSSERLEAAFSADPAGIFCVVQSAERIPVAQMDSVLGSKFRLRIWDPSPLRLSTGERTRYVFREKLEGIARKLLFAWSAVSRP